MRERIRKRKPGFRGSWWVARQGYEVRDSLQATNYVVRMQPTASGEIVPHREEEEFDAAAEGLSTDGPPLRWLAARDMTVWHLFPGEIGQSAHERAVATYEPLKMGGLHRDFAALDLAERSVRAFADRHGLLGFETWHVMGGKDDLVAEPLDNWYSEIRTMRLIVGLWDLYRDPETKREDFAKVVYDDLDYASFSPEAEAEDELPPSAWLYTDVFLPHPHTGRGHDEQARYSAGMLLSAIVSNALGILTVPMVEVRKGGQINLVPRNLLGAMYVLLAQEIMGRTEPPIRCATCGRWFDAGHALRMYCSDACKMKAYRRSKKTKDKENGD
jgi:hypothetical protein